jgi:hypothetical protein
MGSFRRAANVSGNPIRRSRLNLQKGCASCKEAKMPKTKLAIASALALLLAGSLSSGRVEAMTSGASAGVRVATDAIAPLENVKSGRNGGGHGYYGHHPRKFVFKKKRHFFAEEEPFFAKKVVPRKRFKHYY